MAKFRSTYLIILLFIPAVGIAQQQSPITEEEYMDSDSLLIMNKLPIVTSKDSLISLLGTPDSSIAYNQRDRCTNYFFQACPEKYVNLYWGKSEFETCNNQAVIVSIQFKENPALFVSYANRIQLSSETTIDLFKNYYPDAVNEMDSIDVYQDGVYQTVTLPSKKSGSDSSWMFFYRNDKLARMDYWLPC